MINFEFSNTTEIVFGKGTQEQVGEKIRKYSDCDKVLVVYGSDRIKKNGLFDAVSSSLKQQKIDILELGGVKPNPRLSLVRRGIEICRNEKIDFILAIGGGSAIDTAKAIGVGVPYEGDVWDFYLGKDTPKKTLKTAVICTIPAAGSESSLSSVITNEDGWYYPSVNDKTTIAKLYPFSKYDNSTDNGMVTEKVELENEEGLKSNQTVSIKWPFRIIDKTYDPKDITQDTKTVTVTITTNLPMDPSKIPDGWTIVPDTDNHKITKTYNRGDNVNEDVTVYKNKTGDTANTDVTIDWSGNKPSVLPQTGESIKVLALIVLCLGIAIVFVKKVKNNKF